MPIKQTIPTNSSDSVQFGNATTPVAASVTGAEVSTGNGYLALNTTSGGTVTERVKVDANGNVGIGTSSPTNFGSAFKMFAVQGTDYGVIQSISANGSTTLEMMGASGIGYVGTRTNHPLALRTNDTERMRIDASGNVLIGRTSAGSEGAKLSIYGNATYTLFSERETTGSTSHFRFANPNGVVGSIQTSGSSTSYVTSSDYRLKENIAPMVGALDTIAQLKPVTYTWKADGLEGQGFIAHELAEVVPDCVSGEKDAVDADGNPQYQGIDTSFLVATLTAAIQELKAIVDTQAERIAVLESK